MLVNNNDRVKMIKRAINALPNDNMCIIELLDMSLNWFVDGEFDFSDYNYGEIYQIYPYLTEISQKHGFDLMAPIDHDGKKLLILNDLLGLYELFLQRKQNKWYHRVKAAFLAASKTITYIVDRHFIGFIITLLTLYLIISYALM